MHVSTSLYIDKPLESVWNLITDIPNLESFISAIKDITVLHKPETGMYGFKWRETRDVLGKEIRETMTITEYIEYSYYHTHSESYGSIYTCIVSVIPEAKGTKLVLSFDSAAQTPLAKIISFFFFLCLEN